MLLRVVILGLGSFASQVTAGELWRRGDVALSLSGSVRERVVGTSGTDAERFAEAVGNSPSCFVAAGFANCPAFRLVGERDVWQSLTRLRTHIDLRATRQVSATLVYDHELLMGVLDTLERDLGSELATEQFVSLDNGIKTFDLSGTVEGRWRHLLYRAFLQYASSHVDVVLGRQRIAWGVGQLWNPIDRFNPIPPLAIEFDQSPGVDAIDVKWLLSGFTFVEAVYAPQDRARDGSYALRLHGILRDVDYSIIGGVFEEARTGGVDVAANIGGAVARVEAVYSDPERDIWSVGAAAPRELAAFWQVVASIDSNIDIGSGLYVLVEHLYNGNGLGFGRGEAGPLLAFFETTSEPPSGIPPALTGPYVRAASADRFGGSRVVTFSDHLTGVQVGYEPTVALRADVLTIYDWDGTSAAVAPSLRYTPFGSVEFTLGAQLFTGRRASQFGQAENLAFLLAELFF
jgi:hypothetical protein